MMAVLAMILEPLKTVVTYKGNGDNLVSACFLGGDLLVY